MEELQVYRVTPKLRTLSLVGNGSTHLYLDGHLQDVPATQPEITLIIAACFCLRIIICKLKRNCVFRWKE